jgi:exopolysaccharide biosynthesis polyprenyl glycosylphosphotransferase
MALVRRLEGAVKQGTPYWARIVPRLCLFALPPLWGLLQLLFMRITGVHDALFSAHMQFLEVFSFAWIAALECFHAGRCESTCSEHTGALATLKSVCAASLASALVICVLGLRLPSFAFWLTDASIFLLASIAIQLGFRSLFAARRPPSRLLLAFAHSCAGTTAWELIRKQISRHQIPGAIFLGDIDASRPAYQQLSTDELLRAIRRENVEGVLISGPPEEIAAFSRRMEACGGLDTPVRLVGAPESNSFRNHVSKADCIYLVNAGAQPAVSLNYKLLKRAFDVVFSVCVLVVTLPAMIFIALLVKLGSAGPIFFVQDRVGWNGRVFRMYKFRTMRTSPASESDTRWTPSGDTRRTRLGKFLRKYSLDELPQFVNVLKGDMSVVGPRPERPFFVSSFRRQIVEYHRRHELRVGITGWAQVNGLRGNTCIRTRLMYDLYYLQNWGLFFDLKIVLSTVLCVLKGNNPY